MTLSRKITNRIKEIALNYETRDIKYGKTNLQATKTMESVRNYNNRHKIMKRS